MAGIEWCMVKGGRMIKKLGMRVAAVIAFLLIFFTLPGLAEDSEPSRRTLIGLQGVQVIVEELQPNILRQDKYLHKAGLSKVQLQKDIESKLKAAGIKVLSPDAWSKTPGRPVLYVNVNTHESEKYWFAYDIKLELRQVVSLEARPEIKTLANTWGINMTGVVNIGTFNIVRDNVGALVERFVQAYRVMNRK